MENLILIVLSQMKFRMSMYVTSIAQMASLKWQLGMHNLVKMIPSFSVETCDVPFDSVQSDKPKTTLYEC